jgi:hypothetical protein
VAPSWRRPDLGYVIRKCELHSLRTVRTVRSGGYSALCLQYFGGETHGKIGGARYVSRLQ